MNNKKDLGVVFTPQIISLYMSKTLIFHYLTEKTNNENLMKIRDFIFDKKLIKELGLSNKVLFLLKNAKILDPSVGEGSLIIELFTLISELMHLLSPEESKSSYLNILEKNIYAYDINDRFLETTKLKFMDLLKNRKISFNFKHKDFLVDNLDKKIKLKFDIIIANPPYIKEKEHKELFFKFKNIDFYQARMDIWYLFLQYSIDLLKKDGVVSYIIPSNWTTSSGAKKLRLSIFEKTKIMSITDFNEYNVFKDAAIQTMVLSLKKEELKGKEYQYFYLKKPKLEKPKRTKSLQEFLSFSQMDKICFNNKLNNLIFTSNEVNDLLKKIVCSSNFKLKRREEVTQGIVHPQNTVSKSNLKIMSGIKLNEGVFVINEVEKKELNLNEEEKKIVKPTYTTKELKKYFKINKPNFWTIYTNKTFNNPQKIKDYPNIKRHLDKYQKIITSDYKPYGLHRSRKEYFFKKGPKILVARKSSIPVFTYLEDECYPTFTFNVIKSERIDLKYLTILLNSKLMTFYLKYYGKMQGKNFQIDVSPILDMPILKPNSKNNDLIERLNVLLDMKKINKEIILECDRIIYLIYGLTSKEIDILEYDIGDSHEKYFEIKPRAGNISAR